MVEETTKKKVGNWYAIRVHSGFEFAVQKIISQAVESLELKDRIFDVVVPVEKRIKVKSGKRTEKEEKIYPGFVLINMIVDNQTWYVVNNTEHVTGFVGSRTQAEPLSNEEVESIFNRMTPTTVTHEVDFEIGDTVKITEGPFINIDGKIDKIDTERGQVIVLVQIFGRDTPVSLDLFHIKRV